MTLSISIVLYTILLVSNLASAICAEQITPNEVIGIDTDIPLNTARHHTTLYGRVNGRASVLRRGETFSINLRLRRPYDSTTDKYRIEFATGSNPKLDQGTLVYFPPTQTLNETGWGAQLLGTDNGNRNLQVLINLPHDMPIGVWRLRITSKLASTKKLATYSLHEPLYIIFNPWSPRDPVYLARDDARQEYCLNEVGKIYIGSYAQPLGRQWIYGQFDPSVMQATMYLLDRVIPDVKSRADPVIVARAVSALVNANEEGGLLVGNWSGSYGDGVGPWKWSSSAPIFRQYLLNGAQPVKYGQCWVFGGVTTTALRTLGIPARTISNFVSAHDTDASLTVDKFFSTSGVEIEGVNGDSIWNFHVWSEAWMARNDLPPGYGGWQTIDGTPQERSNGRHQLGPASLEAVKQGRVDYGYDTGFVFAEINADQVHWHQDSRYMWSFKKTMIKTGHMGRRMLTKMIGVLNNMDHEDITYQYKFPEGSPEARAARDQAIRLAGLAPLFATSYPSAGRRARQ